MMRYSKNLLVGYDYDAWYGYAKKVPVSIDVSTKDNNHTLICGMSGSGKSYLTTQYLARISLHGGKIQKSTSQTLKVKRNSFFSGSVRVIILIMKRSMLLKKYMKLCTSDNVEKIGQKTW